MSETLLGGRYRIEAPIGAGGMAQVHRGTDQVLGRPVAIKVLAPQFAKDAAFVQRFRREAQAAARLSHPNVVSVYDTGSDDGTHYIVMEYLEGRTLADYLASGGRLTPTRALELAEAVCRALEAAHRQGIVHRDIKPGNVMVTRQGEVKVMDFGIARLADGADTVAQTAAVLGTASYLSPEQARGEPVDERSDLYSLGVVLYEMLTGRPPFTGDSAVSVAYKHVQEAPQPPSSRNPDMPPALDSVVMRCLAKNPANRYQSAAELRGDLERVRRGEAVTAPPLLPDQSTTVLPRGAPPTAALPPQEPEGRGRRTAGIVLATLAVVALLGTGLFVLARALLGGGEEPVPQVEVPPVEGLRLKAAQEALEAAGLTWAIEEVEPPDLETRPGTVLAQEPEAGQMVAEGTEVLLTVAGSPSVVPVPTVAGLTAEEAQALLEDRPYQFEVTVVEEPSEDLDPGLAVRTEPAEGTQLAPGQAITLYVSSGPPEPEMVLVPDVVCVNRGQAKNLIQSKGLVVVEAADKLPPNPECPFGNRIVQQEPLANTQVPKGSQVTVWLPGASPIPSPTED